MCLKQISLALMFCSVIMGCSEAGPFVKNVYRSGDNALTVEKCTIHNGFFVLSEENCSAETFKINRDAK
jgi:hypothetical protein